MPATVPSLLSEAFAAAVARVGQFRGQTVVVKLGGSAMEDAAASQACLISIATLYHLGVHIVLVHGGGKPIDRAMAEAGLVPKKVAGRRYTDAATLAIVVRVLKEEINSVIVAELRNLGCNAISQNNSLYGERLQLTGPDQQPIDLGAVGRVTHVERLEISSQTGQNRLPVIPSLAYAPDGSWLNINADTAACAVAVELRAKKTIFLTDTPGVLRDRHNPQSLLPKLTERECRELIAAGTIEGGMVPKVEACFEALSDGTEAAVIVDGRVPYSLLDVFLGDTFTGTVITR